MNKYLIPAILGAVVLMAGMFAFMPVQKAQTVHTSVNTTVGQLICDELTTDSGGSYNPTHNDCSGD
ncbi:MAG: hypothetical protein QXU32_12790 [Nitrososphaerales archaeon]